MSYSDAAKRARKRNGQSSFRAPRDLEPAGRARYYMKEKGIVEDELVMEGLLATDRVIAAASGRAPPGRNSKIDRNDYDTTDLVTDILTVGRAGQRVVDGAAEGDRHSDRKQRARTAIGNELNGYGEQAIRALCAQDGWVYAPVPRKNPRPAKRNPHGGRMSTSSWGTVPAAPRVPGHFWQARFPGARAEWRLVDGRGSPTGWTVEQSSESAPCVIHGPGGFRAEASLPYNARSIVAERIVKANPWSAKRNPVSVAFTPTRRGGIDVAVNGRVVARAVASLHTAQSAALDGLSYFVDAATARRLVQRAAEQLAGKFAGARAAYANPRAVSIRPGHSGVDAYVDGKRVAHGAISFEEAEEAVFDALVKRGVPRDAASRLARRGTRQGAKRNPAVFPDVEFARRLPALVFTDVPRSDLTRFGDAVRKAYADYFEYELPRLRIVVTTHGASPMQVASTIHRKWIAHQRSAL